MVVAVEEQSALLRVAMLVAGGMRVIIRREHPHPGAARNATCPPVAKGVLVATTCAQQGPVNGGAASCAHREAPEHGAGHPTHFADAERARTPRTAAVTIRFTAAIDRKAITVFRKPIDIDELLGFLAS